jgi:CRP-like cAMP-binding protein
MLACMDPDQLRINLILKALPDAETALIGSDLEPHEMHMGEVILNAEEEIRFLYFPLAAAISVTNDQQEQGETSMVDVTIIGKEGCAGSTIVHGTNKSPSMMLVEIGGTTIRLASAALLEHRSMLPYLWKALSRYSALLYRHAVLSVGCSQFHSPQQRVARWLKAHWHRTGIDEFPFTIEFLTAQAGIDSKTVKEVLGNLQNQGMIEVSWKKIIITDQEALTNQTCSCFGLARKATDEYLQDLVKISARHA